MNIVLLEDNGDYRHQLVQQSCLNQFPCYATSLLDVFYGLLDDSGELADIIVVDLDHGLFWEDDYPREQFMSIPKEFPKTVVVGTTNKLDIKNEYSSAYSEIIFPKPSPKEFISKIKGIVTNKATKPGMKMNTKHSKFQKWLKLLKQFVDKEGHAYVPRTHTVDGSKLGAWVMNTRTEYKKQILERWKISSLEKIPGWHWSGDRMHKHFLSRFKMLKEYQEKYGHLKVPSNYRIQGVALGRWLAVIKSRKNKGKVTPEKVMILNQLPGWDAKRTRGRQAKQDHGLGF